MPILNTKLLLRVLAVTLLVGGGLFVLHRVQAGRVPDSLLWQADRAIEKGKPDRAITYLRQYLEFRPDDHDTAVRLADLLLQRAASARDYSGAQQLYERVLREAPDRVEVARKLVSLCLKLRRFADAYEFARRVQEKAPQDGRIRGQIGECLVAMNRPDEARTEFEAAVSLAPDSVRAHVLYADLLERHYRKPPEAGAVLDRLVQANVSDPTAYLARARYLQRNDRGDDCLRDLEHVFLLDPENNEALVMSAELLQARGEVRRAKETFRDTIALYPRYVHGYRALSWLELLTGNEADARGILERGLAVLPNSVELLTPLADLCVGHGEIDRAAEIVQKLETLHAAAVGDARQEYGLRVGYLRARLLMGKRQWNDALAGLEALRTEAMTMPGLAAQVNLLIAACHERRGDRDAQAESLRRALAADPRNLGAQVALANAHLAAGRFEDALRTYQAAARSPYAGLGVMTAYADLRLALARAANGPAEEWKALESFLTSLRQAQPLAVEPVVLLADCRAARGDHAGAEQVLRDAVRDRAGDPRLWSALANLLGRTRGTLPAADAVGEGQLAAGDSVELRLARARLWAEDVQPGRERRLALLENLPGLPGDADRNRLARGLAELYALIRDESGQKRTLTDLAARNAQDLDTRKALYAIALKAGDNDRPGHWRDEIRRVEGTLGQSAAVVEAIHAARAGEADDRRLTGWQDLARAVLRASPDHGDAHLLLALVASRRQDPEATAKHFDIAADLHPTEVNYQQARLGYYLRVGNDEAVQRALGRLERDPRITPLLFRASVEGAVEEGGPDALTRVLGFLQPRLKRDPRTAVWAGQMLERRGRIADALALYRQANTAHPTFVDGWSARLLAAARVGEAEVGQTMTQAREALDRKAYYLVCAECGPTVRARVPSWAPPAATSEDRRAYAEACISVCEARGRLEDAVPILAALADDKDARPADAAWARQSMAAITAAIGTAEQKREAISALRQQGVSTNSIEDARSRLAALGVAFRSVGGSDRQVILTDMIGLQAGIVRSPEATSNDWYQLAQLHRAAGDRASARKCLEELTRREPKNLFYLAINVEDLVADRRLDDARPLVAQMADGIADPRVLAAAARFHVRDNDPAAALVFVDRFVRAADPGSVEGTARQRQAAELLDQLTRQAAVQGLSGSNQLLEGACERYRASLRAYPDAIVPMTALLAYYGQVQPAFEELDRNRSRLSLTIQVTAGVGILRSGHASPKQFQTVKGWIEEALAGDPDSIPLRLSLGELHALRQDFATAEQVYRDVLRIDPRNAVALNNLAWILAPRPETADQALRFADRAIELYGATGELLDTRARILISAGQYDRAVADLTDAINQGGTPLRYFHLALARQRMDRPDEALDAFRQAKARGLDPKAIHPSDLPAYKAMADRTVQ